MSELLQYLGRNMNSAPNMVAANSSSPPKLTIGMPVYNGSPTIEAALASLLSQTRDDFRILISDNCSTDFTAEICRRISAKDKRVSYHRQLKNLGAVGNFRFVLEAANTPYFMWGAADDLWAPTFVEKCLSFLEMHEDYIACQSKVLFTRRGKPSHMAVGSFAIAHDNPDSNVLAFLQNPSDNSRFYGIYRTPVLQASFPASQFHAHDWAVSARSLRHGKHAELPEVLMIRDSSDISAYQRGVLADHRFPLFRMFPVLAMSGYLLSRRVAPWSPKSFFLLYRLNLYSHFNLSPYRSMRLAQIFLQNGRLLSSLLHWLRGPPSPSIAPECEDEIGSHQVAGVSVVGTYGFERILNDHLSWTDGNAEYLIDSRILGNARQVCVALWPISPEKGMPFKILANGKCLHSGIVANGKPVSVALKLDNLAEASHLALQIKSNVWSPPGDKRSLGVAVRSIRLIRT